ncbi:MAG: hypothetical protein JSV19_04155 [Phycisphaerales bacterium]|nr:MAG: hypothetical protein JSV19_04155 [Phycisphaerales bacterium]
MKRVVVLGFFVLFSCSGCFTLAKRGLTEAQGASGKIIPVKECSASFYASLGGVKVRDMTNGIAPLCSPGMFMRIKTAVVGKASEVSQQLTGSDHAVLDVDVTFYKEPGGVLAVAGKSGLLIGRAIVTDDAGQQRGDLLIAVASEAVRTSETEMAETFGETLIGHIVKRTQNQGED